MVNIPRNAVLILGLGQFGQRVVGHLRARLDAVDARRTMFFGGDRPDLFDETTPYHGMRRFLDNCLELRGQVPLANDLTALTALRLDERTGALELATPLTSEPEAEAERGEDSPPAGQARFQTEALLPPIAEAGTTRLSRRQLFTRLLEEPAVVGEHLLEKLTPLFSQKNFPNGEVTCTIYVAGALTELSVSAMAWPVTAALRHHVLQKLGPTFSPRLRVVGLFSLAVFGRPEPAAEAAALAALQEFEHFSDPASRVDGPTAEFFGAYDPLFGETCGRRLWMPCYLLDRAKLEPPLQVKDEYELVCSAGNFLEAGVVTSLAAVIDNRCHNYVADMERLAPYSTLGAVTHSLPIQELANRAENFRVKEVLRSQVLLVTDAGRQEALRQAARQDAQKVVAEEFSVEALLKELVARSGRLVAVDNPPAKAGEAGRPLPAPRLAPRLDRPRAALGFQASFLSPAPPRDWYSQGLGWYRQEMQSWFRPEAAAALPPTREERLRTALGLETESDLLQRWSQACAAPAAPGSALPLVEAWMRRVMELTSQRLGGEAGLLSSLYFLEALAAGLDRERFRLLEREEAPQKRDFDLRKHQWLTRFMKLAETRPDGRRLLLRLLLIAGAAGLPAADFALRATSLSDREAWGLGILAGAAALSGLAALITLGAYALRTRRLQGEFLQIYWMDLGLTIEDRVYQTLKQVYGLAHGLVTHLCQYLRQTYDALNQYSRSSYAWQQPEDSFTFRTRFHSELNRRILAPSEAPAAGQRQPARPTPAALTQILQFQVALYLVAGHTPSAAAARLARESLAGSSLPAAATLPQALARVLRELVRQPAQATWRALPGSAQLTLEDFLADTIFADGAPLSLAEQVDQLWKQALPNLDVNRNMMRDELKDHHPGWELRQQNFAEVVPLQHEAMVLGLPGEANPAFAKSAGQIGATQLASFDPFALTFVRTVHGLRLSTDSFPRFRYLWQAFVSLGDDARQQLCLPVAAPYPKARPSSDL